jgi:hypothetical protein
MYNAYMNENTKILGFVYKNKAYKSGTKVLYNGKCILNDEKIDLDNVVVSYMYSNGKYEYFQDDDNIYMCPLHNFEKYIVQIINNENITPPNKETEELYWTDEMVTKTIWYVLVMLIGTIFYDRILIWIFATIIWYNSTFKKK